MRATARSLASSMKEARRSQPAPLTAQEVARRIGRDPSIVSRWESGKTVPPVAAVAEYLKVIGVTGERREVLLQMARNAAERGSWVMPGVPRQVAAMIEDERAAHRIVAVQPLLIPGILQIEAFTRAIMVGAGRPRNEIDQAVLVRLGRQSILTQPKPPEFLAIIGEHALRFPPCTAEVMTDQLDWLLTQGERPNVTIVVLPSDVGGYTPAMEGPFSLLEFDDSEALVRQDHYRSVTSVADKVGVRDYKAAVDVVYRGAMDPAASREFILEMRTGWERRVCKSANG